MGIYESDITKFIPELKQQKPQIEEDQKKSRAIWWDHPQDLETLERAGFRSQTAGLCVPE